MEGGWGSRGGEIMARVFGRAFATDSRVATVMATGMTLWLTAPVWRAGPPAGADTLAHLIRAEFALEHIFDRGRIDGWQPSFALGYQEFLFIGPVFTWIVGLGRWLSLGQVSVLDAFKLAIVLSFVAFPIAVVFLARSFGLSRRAAGVAAVLSLTLSSPFGGAGLDSAFKLGLVVHQLGAAFFCLSLGSVLRLVVEPQGRWVAVTGLTTGLLLMTHGVSVILLGLLLPIVFAVLLLQGMVSRVGSAKLGPAREGDLRRAAPRSASRRKHVHRGRSGPHRSSGRGTLATVESPFVDTIIPVDRTHLLRVARSLCLALGLAAVLAAFVLLPLVVHRDLGGPVSRFPYVSVWSRLASIWRGEILLQTGVALFVVGGWCFGLSQARRSRPLVTTMLVTPLAFLFLGEALKVVLPENTVSFQIPSRGLAYAGVIAILPLAGLVTHVGQLLIERIGGIVAIGLAAAIVLLPMGDYRDLARPAEPIPAMRETAERLRALVPDGARFAVQHNLIFDEQEYVTGVRHPDFWLAWASGRYMLNVFNIESSSSPQAALEPTSMVGEPADVAADKLARYGVTHVVLLHTLSAQAMLHSQRFSVVWSSPPMTILAVHPRPGQPAPESLTATEEPATARLVHNEPEHLRIAVDAERPTSATLAVAWSPKWHARLDGRPIPLARTGEGLLTVEVPAGPSTVALDFRRDVWDVAGPAISLLTLGGLLLWSLRQARNKRQGQTFAE